MISLSKIERWTFAERFSELLEAVLANGRPLPLSVRLRLSHPSSSRLASAGLALQRAIELSYFPVPASVQLARVVAEALAEDDPEVSPAARAVAAAGLVDLVQQFGSCGKTLAPDLEGLIEHGLGVFGRRAFEAHAAASGTARDGLVGDELDTAVLLWQLAHRPGLGLLLEQFIRTPLLDRAARRLGLWRRADTGPLLALLAAPPVSAAPMPAAA